MNDLPLHALVVHFPVVLGALSPVVIMTVLWGRLRLNWSYRAWVVVIVLQVLLFASVMVATELGERDEERVERVVAESVIEKHAEWGDKLPWASGVVLVFALLTYFQRDYKMLSFGLLIASLVCTGLVVLTGHSGAELVYKHNAAKAFAVPDGTAVNAADSNAQTDSDGD